MRQIAIVGTAPSTRHLVPEGWEVWMMGAANSQEALRFDVWFELHRLAKLESLGHHDGYLEWLKSRPEPVYVQNPEIMGGESAVRFPIGEVVAEFKGAYLANFLSSSPALAMALAIMQKPDKIGLWGIDMDNRGQKDIDLQKPGCSYFAIEAMKRGIEMIFPDQCTLLSGGVIYGYHEPDIGERRLLSRKKQIDDYLANTSREVADLKATMDYHEARREEIEYALQNRYWKGIPQV